MENFEHVHLKIGIQCLTRLGFWPKRFKTKTTSFLYVTYFRSLLVFYVTFVASEFIEMFFVIRKQNLNEFSILMETTVLNLHGLVKIYVMAGRTFRRLTKKVGVTEERILKSEDEEVRRIYMEHVRKNYSVNKIMSALANSTIVLYISTPLILELVYPTNVLYEVIDNSTIVYKPRPLPLASWFPFDRYKYYKTSFLIHSVALLILPTYIVACNNYFFGISIFAIGQIKILQNYVLNIAKTGDEPGRSEADVNAELRKCISYQKSIMVFVQELSGAMKGFFIFDFVACAMEIAMIGFQAAVMNLGLSLAKQLTYLTSILTQLFFYYWHANEIRLESMELANAAWNSDWYNFNRNNKLTLSIFMMKSQRPMTLSVGPFYQMSTETMMVIIRAGYSYAAIMRRLHSSK